MRKIVLDPVTRLEGHLKVEVDIDGGKVVEARAVGTMFRGFETILNGRDPRDAVPITQRICGVCPVSHATAATLALEEAFGIGQVPTNGRLIRNIVLGGNYLQSHIIHFYHLSLPDYVKLPDNPLFANAHKGDMRLNAAANQQMVDHYFKALEIRRKAHELVAHFGGKMPHQVTIVPGGTTQIPTQARIDACKALLAEIAAFVENEYQSDVNTLATAYSDMFQTARGVGRMLSYGGFPLDDGNQKFLFASGVNADGVTQKVDRARVSEDVTYAWYDKSAGGDPLSSNTQTSADKSGAYTWVKAPRYGDEPCEVGPLARMIISGYHQGGISAMDRIVARYTESRLVARHLAGWLDELTVGAPVAVPYEIPESGTGIGMMEAPRGALLHAVRFSGMKITGYQAVVPTTWNASPRDAKNVSGPLEKALLGLEVPDPDNPLPVVRVVHSFDPCLACAVHMFQTEPA